MVNLKVRIGSLELSNPIMSASGTFGYGLEFADKLDLKKIGAFVTKGLSLKKRLGNQMPRICETPAGMINSIGLENVGMDAFETEKLPLIHKTGAVVMANFFGETEEEYVESARRLEAMDGVHALEMNVSCPNVEKGGIEFGSDPAFLEKLTKAVKKVVKKPLIVKLSPNVADIRPFASAVENGGGDAISAINTLKGMSIDVKSRTPKIKRVFGGLSGPAIKPVALRMVYECCNTVKIPVIGIGGIASLNDALEFLMAGATAVQIGTMNFVEPEICQRIAGELSAWCVAEGVSDITTVTGSLKIA
ncbi:MAG: dihydroorotate dehydrogenase [Nitrospinae bacterium]|nr:dihydroorotate dehydrogenase [Nitrospinota bacterium]